MTNWNKDRYFASLLGCFWTKLWADGEIGECHRDCREYRVRQVVGDCRFNPRSRFPGYKAQEVKPTAFFVPARPDSVAKYNWYEKGSYTFERDLNDWQNC